MTTNSNKELGIRNAQDVQNLPVKAQRQYRLPATDVYETPDAYVLMIDIPGVAKGDVAVRIENGELLIRADMAPLHAADAAVLHREHVADGYDRVFSLGSDIDTGTIDAQLENGVLTIKLLKSERVKAREISIR